MKFYLIFRSNKQEEKEAKVKKIRNEHIKSKICCQFE